MIRYITTSAVLALSTLCLNAIQITFTGQQHKVIEEKPDRSSGLDCLYIVYDVSEISEIRIAGISESTSVQRYSNLGGGYAQLVETSYDGQDLIISNPEGNMGYIIETSPKPTYIWIVNYKPYAMTLNSVAADAEQECENTRIIVDGKAETINYYSIDGRPIELNRDIKLNYYNLEWDESLSMYQQTEQTKTLNHLTNPIVIMPPLYCNSIIDITGDRFLIEWNMGIHCESSLIHANGLECKTSAVQTNDSDEDEEDTDASNMIRTEGEGLGGSAPADIEFRAYTSDAVMHNEWQIADDPDFEYLQYRFNEQNLNYTFNEEGQFYVRYIGSNADGTCETIGETYAISIGSSELRIPNAFTPNNDGVNDIWKVGYRSLLEFKCSIFDRYGTELFTFNDPSQGWDGKYKGKVVNPGVYFYVIEAKGADGKHYKKGGDINIVKSKKYTDTNSAPD